MDGFLRDVPLFVEVARQKSFTRAAEVLDMPLSTLSRRILGLERRLDVQLFYRSARKVEPTESGKAFFERCSFIVAEARAAREELTSRMKSPRGLVRLALPADVYHGYLAGALGGFAAKWPDIRLHVHLSERWVDLLSEPYDLDIRVGPLPDSGLRTRKLLTLKPALYASPGVLERYGLPQSPADLRNMPCISLVQQGGVWTMHEGKKQETISIEPAHLLNSASVALEFGLAGLGVVWLLPAQAARYERSGQLVRLLPRWRHFNLGLNLVMAGSQPPHRIRLLIDHLAAYCADLPE